MYNETNCHSMLVPISISDCSVDEFRCNNGNCIPKAAQCNGEIDCDDDGEDEQNCGEYHLEIKLLWRKMSENKI